MKGTTRRAIALVAIALAGLATTACSGDEEPAKADGGGSVTLRIGTDDEPGRPAADQIEELARRVAELSDGALRLEPVWHAAGDGPDWDQRVARMVSAGELDMGLIPSRSWDTEGVTSLRALNAPFLVTSDELVADIISGELAGKLLSGLGEAGVEGIALFPEGLRHPFGYEKPLLRPADYEGNAIRTPTSRTTSAVFAALGATANDDEADPSTHAGLESSYALDPGGTAAGNVTFYPKVNALVVDEEAFAGLSEAQRTVLQQAAEDTREWAIGSVRADADAAKAFCEQGGAVALASDADLAALERATAPVTAELEGDPGTRAIIAAIREAKAAMPAPAVPEACDDEAGGDQTAIDGVYRFELTDEQLADQGITDPADVAENHGVYTVTLDGGEYCWEQTASNPLDNPDECSTYEIDGDELEWHFPAGVPDVYRWRQEDDGDLRLSVVRAAPDGIQYARAWALNAWDRIGDAP